MGFTIQDMLSGDIVKRRDPGPDNSSAGLGQMLSFLMNSNQQPVAQVAKPEMPSLSELAAISAGRRKEKEQADATEQMRQLIGTRPEAANGIHAPMLGANYGSAGSGYLRGDMPDKTFASILATNQEPAFAAQGLEMIRNITKPTTAHTPYYQTIPGASNGAVVVDTSTGLGKRLIVDGQPVIGGQYDTGVQTQLAEIKNQNELVTLIDKNGIETQMPRWEYEGRHNPNIQPIQQQSTAVPQANGSSVAQTNVSKNNPYNAKEPGKNTFQSFSTPEAGRQWFKGQMGLYKDRNINTIEKIISTYSPPNENDTAGLISNAEKFTGIPKDQVLNMDDPQVLDMLSNMTLKNEGNLPDASTAPLSRVTNAQTTSAKSEQTATGTKTGEYHAGEVLSLPSKIERANLLRGLLVKAVNHPGLEGVVAVKNLSDLSGFPGTEEQNFKVLMNQITGINFLDAYSQLKGGGAISDVEGQAAKAAKARLDTAQSEPEFKAALNEMITTIDRETKAQEVRVNGANSPSNAFKERGSLQIKSNSPVEAKPKVVNGKPIITNAEEYLNQFKGKN
jgi:hypothetical protein